MILAPPVPADKLIPHEPPERVGDCFRACLATLLGKPAAEVPHVMVAEDWHRAALDYLAPLGLGLASVDFPPLAPGAPFPVLLPPGAYVILYGKLPTGVPHAVVGKVTPDRGVSIWHDPNPSRAGLEPGSIDGVAMLVPLHEVDR